MCLHPLAYPYARSPRGMQRTLRPVHCFSQMSEEDTLYVNGSYPRNIHVYGPHAEACTKAPRYGRAPKGGIIWREDKLLEEGSIRVHAMRASFSISITSASTVLLKRKLYPILLHGRRKPVAPPLPELPGHISQTSSDE